MGKGSRRRPGNIDAYHQNYTRIFDKCPAPENNPTAVAEHSTALAGTTAPAIGAEETVPIVILDDC